MILDRNSAVPLYYQIRQQLLEQIQSGELSPGQPIPSEHELSARFGVSRMTARQATKSLGDEGVVYSRPGLGTFVSGSKQLKTSSELLSFTQEMKSRGTQPSSCVLAFDEVAVETEVARALHLAAKAKVFRLKRVRMADSLPMCVEESFLSAKLCPALLETFDPRKSLYQVLADRYGIRMTAADEVAEASLAHAEDARLLKIKKGSPVFVLTRVSYAQSSQPVEFVRSIYRGDRWMLVSRLIANQNAGSSTITPKAVVANADTALPRQEQQRAGGDGHLGRRHINSSTDRRNKKS